MPALFRDWNEYITHFCAIGGVIEASPTCNSQNIGSIGISFLIEPDGIIELVSSYDKF